MNKHEAESLLNEIRAALSRFQNNASQETIAGCIAALEKFGKLDLHIREGGVFPTSWED